MIKAAASAASIRRTGGGEQSEPLTEEENRIVSLMGNDVVEG